MPRLFRFVGRASCGSLTIVRYSAPISFPRVTRTKVRPCYKIFAMESILTERQDPKKAM